MRKWIPIGVVTALSVVAVLLLAPEQKASTSVVINEVCSRSSTGEDYIELYNATSEKISLDGWFLSDDKENPDKQRLNEFSLDPYGYLVLYATGEIEKENHLNFKIDQNGEQIFLSNPQAEIVDQVYVPSMSLNTVYARETDGSHTWDIYESTMGMSNADAIKAIKRSLEMPVFSHESGYYDEKFVLNIQVGKGQQIYYTTDGSMPTEQSLIYEDGILIENISHKDNVINAVQNVVADWKDYQVMSEKADKVTVIRAVAMDDKGNASDVVTATYLVGLEKYRDKNVLSIVAEPSDLTGADGIFITGSEYDEWYLSDMMSADGTYEQGWTTNYELTNFWKSGRENEIFGNAQFFKNGSEYLNQSVGIRTQGNFTRMNDKKSIQLFSRNVYSGSSMFGQKLLGDYNSHAVYVSAFPEKAYYMNLMEGRNVGLQAAEEYALFINGEYWYNAVLMEKYDETYFAEHYGVNENNILYEKDRVATIGEEHAYLFDDLVDYLRDESISQEEKAAHLYEEVDVQSLIDWLCFQLYVCNNDVSYKKNSTHWRTIVPEDSAYGDGKWRWVLYDIDHAATYVEPTSISFQDFSVVVGNRFYDALRTSPHFCRQFVLTAMDLMNTNFSLENVERVLGEWGFDLSYANGFFVKRPEYMVESLRNEFGLTGTVETVQLSANDAAGGRIYINTTEADVASGTWNGQYFTDYPVKIVAEANPGYRFVGWSGSYELSENQIEVDVVEGGIILTAVFEKE